ncbi:MAG: DUF1940 domain-containing protein [Thermoplasmataceae archaeon]
MDEERYDQSYCELTDSLIRADHPFFFYLSEIQMAQAELGKAISSAIRLQETRAILDMLDAINGHLFDPDEQLPDRDRKMLNHAENVWLDVKQKLGQGDIRVASLLTASAHMRNAVSYLLIVRGDAEFSEKINDYVIKYLTKLSIHTYREAIGHVLL